MNTTVITSLYNIDRQNLDGRQWNSYLDWFSKTLSVNNPMVVFVEESLKPFVELHRLGRETHIVVSNLSDSKYYSYKEKIDSIIENPLYIQKIKSPDRVECKSSLYNIIQYSKFYWVQYAAELNPFNTDNFLWLDAGISRFFESIDLNRGFGLGGQTMPNDRILLQIFMLSYPDLANATDMEDDYFWDDRSYVAGGIFMVHREFAKVINDIMEKTIEQILNDGVMNNEQISLGYLIKKHPHMFELFRHHYTIHRNYEILNLLNQ